MLNYRYWGDEDKPNDENEATTSLQSLLAKIEERRKRQKPTDSTAVLKSTAEVKPSVPHTDEPPLKVQKIDDSIATKATEEPGQAVVTKNVSKNDDFTIIDSIEFRKNQKVL